MNEFHTRKNRSIFQQFIQRSFHYAESLLRDRSVGRLFLIIRAERRLIKADQRISPCMSANDEKSLNRCRRSHCLCRLAGNQAQCRRFFTFLRKLFSKGFPPISNLFGLQYRLTVDPKGYRISRLDFHSVEFFADFFYRFRRFQCTYTGPKPRLCLRCTAECFQKKTTLGWQFAILCCCIRHNNRTFLNKNITFISALRKASNIRTQYRFLISQIDADMIIVFRK